MLQQAITAETIREFLATHVHGAPVHFFSPERLDERMREFRRGFPGEVTFAVKSNPTDEVIKHLCAGGLDGFDVASPEEIAQVGRLCPNAPMHYNNPVRSRDEIAIGVAAGVKSWSVDAIEEFDKLLSCGLPEDAEVAVRFKLPVKGAAYDFGAKFGADETEAVALLKRVAESGRHVAMTFHVGTQCTDPAAYVAYITAAARLSATANVQIERLNVGGGFPSGRDGQPRPLEPFFAAIRGAMDAFEERPVLLCEPGRGMVGDAYSYAVRVKSLRGDTIYLTDGIYGGLSEMVLLEAPALAVLGHDGNWKEGPRQGYRAFGPTCDSVDQLKMPLHLPTDIDEGDWIVFRSMGAYVTGVTTRFNGYGDFVSATVKDLSAPYLDSRQV